MKPRIKYKIDFIENIFNLNYISQKHKKNIY